MSPTPPTFSHLVLIFKPFFFLFKPPGFSHLVKQQGQLGLFKHAYSDKNKVYSEILNTQEKLSMQLQNMIQPTAKKKKAAEEFHSPFLLVFHKPALVLYFMYFLFIFWGHMFSFTSHRVSLSQNRDFSSFVTLICANNLSLIAALAFRISCLLPSKLACEDFATKKKKKKRRESGADAYRYLTGEAEVGGRAAFLACSGAHTAIGAAG